MTPKQQAFAREYAIDKNATQAAIRAGYDWPNTASKFYVYFLIDGRSGTIFYVGKGKGDRIIQHRRDARRPSPVNAVKTQRIRDCGKHLVEQIFADGLSEGDALDVERRLIQQLREFGLTNITSGNVHPLESQLARIDANLDAVRPFDEWINVARPDQVDAVTKLKGSPEQFYAFFVGSLLRLREELSDRLEETRHA